MFEEKYSLLKVSVEHGSNIVYGNKHSFFNNVEIGSFVVIGDDLGLYVIDGKEENSLAGAYEFKTIVGGGNKLVQEIVIDGPINLLENEDEISFDLNREISKKSIFKIIKRSDNQMVCQIYQPFKDKDKKVIEGGIGTWSIKRNCLRISENYAGPSKYNCSFIIGSSVTPNLKIPLVEFENKKYRAIYWSTFTKIDELAGKLENKVDTGERAVKQEIVLQNNPISFVNFQKDKPSDRIYSLLLDVPYRCKIAKVKLKTDGGKGIIKFLNGDQEMFFLNVTEEVFSFIVRDDFYINQGESINISVKNIEQIEGLNVYFEFFSCN